MKKIVFCIVLCIIVIFSVVACSNTNIPQETKELGISVLEIGAAADSMDGGVHISEYETWSESNCNPHTDTAAPASMKVSFNGKEYIGEYWYSIVEVGYPHMSDYYTCEDGWFSVNRDNKKLETILFMSFDSGKLSVDECRKSAETIAQQYIDLSQYRLTATAGDPVHSYQFIKMMGNLETTDRLSVGVSSSGEITSFTNFTFEQNSKSVFANSANTNSVVESLSSSTVDASLEEKIESIYSDYSSYSIVNERVVELENDGVGILYTIDVDLEPTSLSDGEIMLNSSRIQLLVCQTNDK